MGDGGREEKKIKRRKKTAPDEVVSCAIDIGTANFSYCIARWRRQLEETDKIGIQRKRCPVEIVSWKVRDIREEKKKREDVVMRLMADEEKLFASVTHFDIEQQNPTDRSGAQRKIIAQKTGTEKKERSYAGNSVAYGLSRAIYGAIVSRRKCLGLPEADVRFVSPRSKFHTFGVDCPKTKSARKTLSGRFVRSFLARYSHQYARWKLSFDAERKQDDLADTLWGCLSRIVRASAGLQ